jgi:restriction endonuclease S subunit
MSEAIAQISNTWKLTPLSEIATPIVRPVDVVPGNLYRTIGVKWWGEGAYERETIDGSQIVAKTLSIVREGDLIINKIWVRHGSTAIAGKDVDGCAGSGEFPTFELNPKKVLARWIHWQTKTKFFWEKCAHLSQGTSGKNRIKPELFLTVEIPLPPLEEQRRIVARIEELVGKVEEARGLRRGAIEEVQSLRIAVLKSIRESLTTKYPCRLMGDLTKVSSGSTPHRDVSLYWNGNIPWLKTGELLDSDIYKSEEHITEEGLSNSGAKLFPIDTILVAMYGQGQTRGRTGRLLIEASTNQACAAILPNPKILEPRFVQYC